MSKFFRVKDFEKSQHYKKRNPPWIKLYYEMLNDDEFISMSIESRHHYMTLLLIASRKNNVILYDMDYLRKVMRLDEKPDLSELIERGFLLASGKHRASKKLDSCKQDAMPETEYSETEYSETEYSETETPIVPLQGTTEFDEFWKSYPRKVGKEAARKAWGKAKGKPPVGDILLAIEQQKQSDQWRKDGGQFIPHPATWLNQGRWADEVRESTGVHDPSGFLAGMKSFLERG